MERNITRQKIDYLGIPFRCTLCRKTGHLRKSCTGIFEEEILEETLLELASMADSPTAPYHLHIPDYPDDGSTPGLDSLSGKLKSICPTLYSSLSSLELDLIDKSSLPNSGPAFNTLGDCHHSQTPHYLSNHHPVPNFPTTLYFLLPTLLPTTSFPF
jgi:hypothetical protein